jgi:hypothetical protein
MSDQINYADEFHNFYETAKRLVDTEVLDVGKKINKVSDSEEQDFLMAVTTFFLQKRQKEVIEKGLF